MPGRASCYFVFRPELTAAKKTMTSSALTSDRPELTSFFFLLGDYYISRVCAEPAFGAIRSRTRTTHWW
jgi:hypothetical protein